MAESRALIESPMTETGSASTLSSPLLSVQTPAPLLNSSVVLDVEGAEAESGSNSSLASDGKEAPQEQKASSGYKPYLKILLDLTEVGAEAALWQVVADAFDDGNNVNTNSSYFNAYPVAKYLLRATLVGSIQGLTTATYSFLQGKGLLKSLQFGACSFMAGFVWQPLADVFPLNTSESGIREVIANNAIVGFGTAATLVVSKKVLCLKPDEMPVFATSMGAVGFADAYTMPAPEPKGVRGSLGSALYTAAATAVGTGLEYAASLLPRIGWFSSRNNRTTSPVSTPSPESKTPKI